MHTVVVYLQLFASSEKTARQRLIDFMTTKGWQTYTGTEAQELPPGFFVSQTSEPIRTLAEELQREIRERFAPEETVFVMRVAELVHLGR